MESHTPMTGPPFELPGDVPPGGYSVPAISPAAVPPPPTLTFPVLPSPARRHGPGWLVIALCVVVALLVGAVGAEAVQIHRVDQRAARSIARTVAAEAQDRAATEAELSADRQRLAKLEKATKGSINATAVAAEVRPSVVRVSTGTATGSAFAFVKTATGTRFITNFHVVADVVQSGGRTVDIERGDESFPATIIRSDKGRDLAVLQTTAKFPVLAPAEGLPDPGSPVVVVGSPLGIEDSVTAGVVSAVRPRLGTSEKQIQIDAPVSPGNSGGPVVDADGHVLGVVQQKIVGNGAEGLAFAIPVSEVCTVAGC
jgi:putative serine protease PepD